MKLHYWVKAKEQRELNDNWFLACKASWRTYDSKYTRDKSKVTCLKCKDRIKHHHFS